MANEIDDHLHMCAMMAPTVAKLVEAAEAAVEEETAHLTATTFYREPWIEALAEALKPFAKGEPASDETPKQEAGSQGSPPHITESFATCDHYSDGTIRMHCGCWDEPVVGAISLTDHKPMPANSAFTDTCSHMRHYCDEHWQKRINPFFRRNT